MGVPMTYLDFAPEPPAPTATPVNVNNVNNDMNCAPSNDTKDLSSNVSNFPLSTCSFSSLFK